MTTILFFIYHYSVMKYKEIREALSKIQEERIKSLEASLDEMTSMAISSANQLDKK